MIGTHSIMSAYDVSCGNVQRVTHQRYRFGGLHIIMRPRKKYNPISTNVPDGTMYQKGGAQSEAGTLKRRPCNPLVNDRQGHKRGKDFNLRLGHLISAEFMRI